MELQPVSPSELQGFEGGSDINWGKVVDSALKGSVIGTAVGATLVPGPGTSALGAFVGAIAGATKEIIEETLE
jgi:hypothetical protein